MNVLTCLLILIGLKSCSPVTLFVLCTLDFTLFFKIPLALMVLADFL